jgi:hypothetical protein
VSLNVLDNAWIPSVTLRYETILGHFAILAATTIASPRHGLVHRFYSWPPTYTIPNQTPTYQTKHQHTKPNTNIPNASPPFPPSNCTTSPTPPNTKLIPVSDCLPHLTFGGPEPPKSQNQSITRLPMAITRQACEIPMRCDAAHPTPHPSRLNAGPHGMKKHILPI